MPAVLSNTTTTDKYTDVELGGDRGYAFGSLTIANNPVSLLLRHGQRGQYSETEYPFVTPTTLPLVAAGHDLLVGVQIKSAVAGSPAQVSGWLVEPDVAGIQPGAAFTSQVSAGGAVTPGQASVQVDKDGVVIGTEPILDLRDGIASLPGMLWAVADNVANTKVTARVLGAPIVDVVAGNSLPAGEEGLTVAYYPDSVNFPDALWELRYSAAAGHWRYMGGSPLVQADGAGVATFRQNTVDTTWQNMPSLSVLTMAHAGKYHVLFGGGQALATNLADDMQMGVSVNGAAPGGVILRRHVGVALGGTQDMVPAGAAEGWYTVTAGQTLALQMQSAPHGNVAYTGPWWSVEPVYLV